MNEVSNAFVIPEGALFRGVTSAQRRVSIFADGADLRARLADNVLAAGFATTTSGTLDDLIECEMVGMADLLIIDLPELSDALRDVLAKICRGAHLTGLQIIISTSMESLGEVFAFCHWSSQILVAPKRADWIIALGRVLLSPPKNRVCDMSEVDRITLLRLVEQLGEITDRLEQMGDADFRPKSASNPSAFRFEPTASASAPASDEVSAQLIRATRPALPDPRLVRRIIRQRQLRARFFEGDLFADPAWDMLLDLTAARAEHTRVSVTSLCIASGVPPTTALRWIGQMTEAGLLDRVEDETDRRRAFVTLTEKASEAMARYFVDLGREASRLV